MRVLVLANSYPTNHSPSGAPYITARLRAARDLGRPMRALALVPHYTGAERLARRVTRSLTNVDVALSPAAHEFTSVAVPWGLADTWHARTGRFAQRLAERGARQVLRSQQAPPDVVLAHGMYVLSAGAVAQRVARAWGVPYVVGMHGSDVLQVMNRVGQPAVDVLNAAAATTYVSESLRSAALTLGAPRDASHVVPNGVDPAIFTPSDRPTDPATPLRLLFVGNLQHVKGADRLPSILQAVRRRHPDARLEVVGSGPLEPRLQGVDGVMLHGRLEQSDVAAHMRGASCLLIPSRSEGWGCVASEAYAVGLPVVASAVGGLTESVAPAGLVPAGDDHALVQGFADAVDRVLTDESGHPPVLTWADVATRELGILDAVLGNS